MQDDDDDSNKLETLLDDVQISSLEEQKKSKYDQLLPMPEFGFPSFVSCEGAPHGFGKGIYADIDATRNLSIISRRRLPFPEYLFSDEASADKNKKANAMMLDAFNRHLATKGMLWCDFSFITPTFLLLLTGKVPITRIAMCEQFEATILEEYESQKKTYEEGYRGYEETKNRWISMRERCVFNAIDSVSEGFFPDSSHPHDCTIESVKKLERDVQALDKVFTHIPNDFACTKQGQDIISRYLTTRARRIKEIVSTRQYTWGYRRPVDSIYRILFMYHRMRDLFEAHGGFMHTASDTSNHDKFLAVCRAASYQYELDLVDIFNHVLNTYTEVHRAIQALHRTFDGGILAPCWESFGDFFEKELRTAMRVYTVRMVAAVELCLMTMVDIPEDMRSYLSVLRQPQFFRLLKDDDARFNDIADARAYTGLIHTLRAQFLPKWKPCTDPKVACFDDREDETKVKAFLRSVILNLAMHTYERPSINRTYLQLKQVVRPSSKNKKVLEQPTARKMVLHCTDTRKPVQIFI